MNLGLGDLHEPHSSAIYTSTKDTMKFPQKMGSSGHGFELRQLTVEQKSLLVGH